MKKLQVILTVLIVSSMLGGVGFTPVGAAKTSTAYAYIRLIKDDMLDANGDFLPPIVGDARTLLAMRANQTYRRMLPSLWEAQARGEILDFQPQLNQGVLIIEYKASADLSGKLQNYTAYTDFESAVVNLPSSTDVHAAVVDPKFEHQLYSTCFQVYGLDPNYQLSSVVKNKAGKAIAIAGGLASASGYIYTCFSSLQDFSLRPGYRIIHKIYNPGGTFFSQHVTVVPNLKFVKLNNAKSKATVAGPKNKPFVISWYHPKLDAAEGFVLVTQAGMFSAKGRRTVDLGTVRFRGGDDFMLEMTKGEFLFSQYMSAPHLICLLERNCGISGFAFRPAFLEITKKGVAHRVSGEFDSLGYFGGVQISRGDSANDADSYVPLPVKPSPGNVLRGTKVKSYKLPRLKASINYVTDVIFGRAPKNSYFGIVVTDGTLYNQLWVHSNAKGVYKGSSLADLDPGKPYLIRLLYRHKNRGHDIWMITIKSK